MEPGKGRIHLLRRHWTELLMALLLLGFFLTATAHATRVNFGSDEMMNIHRAWFPGIWKILWANLKFWSTFTRPMGALFYWPLFELFGLNPVPYSVARIGVLLLSAIIFYFLAARITRSRCIAALSTMPVAYHAGLGSLVYEGAFIYDGLCGCFYFAALLYYIHCREKYGLLRPRQTVLFLALFICALNSKEMAVSLPVIVFAYELLSFIWRKRTAPEIRSRLRAHAGPALAAIAINIIYIAGKTLGSGTLTALTPYRPVFTWARFSESNVRFLNTLFYTSVFDIQLVILAWLALLYVGLRNRDRRLLLLWVWVIVTPLPIVFIPDRGGPCLYIVAAGWAMACSILIVAFARLLAREPVFRWLPRRIFVSFPLAVWVYFYVAETNWRRIEDVPHHLSFHQKTRRLIEQFRASGVRPRHGSSIVFLNDPFPENYDTLFIAALHWNDRSLHIEVQNQSHFTESELSEKDYIFDFPEGKLTQVRAP